MPLDPKARALIDLMTAAGAPPLSALSPAELRAGFAAMVALQAPGDPAVRAADRAVPGPGGDIPIRIYTPPADGPLPVLVYFHGGGWVIGDLDSHDAACRALARAVPALVVAVHYRLAPEARFPAAPDDCYAATSWVAAHAASLGGDPERIAVGGDSAGGNLAAVTALRARAAGPRLVFQLLVYPATDAHMEHPSQHENADGYLLTGEAIRWFYGHYLRSPGERTDPHVSPLRAPDLRGLPPALVITAEFDPLRDEGEAYGARLRAAGVPATVSRYPGMIHGFFQMTANLAQAVDAQQEAAAALRAAFGVA